MILFFVDKVKAVDLGQNNPITVSPPSAQYPIAESSLVPDYFGGSSFPRD